MMMIRLAGWLFQCYTGTPAYEPLIPIMCKYDMSSIKPEVHNALQRRQRRTESQTYVTCRKICEDRNSSSGDMFADRQTYKQTDRHGHHNTSPPLLGRTNNWCTTLIAVYSVLEQLKLLQCSISLNGIIHYYRLSYSSHIFRIVNLDNKIINI